METIVVNTIRQYQFSIQPIKKINLNPDQQRQEQYAAKKKPDKLFSEVLSGEIASATNNTAQSRGKMNYGLNSLAVRKWY